MCPASLRYPPPHAILGATNTGKTHYAIERMLGYRSGMIGFPLRLLARENYDKVVAKVGADSVALITGEEKIIPPDARYYLCTVEAMPLERQVSFLAIDEVQLAADRERGHIFTDRILKARGTDETLLLGAETIRHVLEALVSGIKISTRTRMSALRWSGHKKITRLPRRLAVVAFSAAEIYRLAEVIRRQRGGAAIVMGALSPRTRNAQVELFEAGEVDYMVATDAIGMGLNMNIDHIALAGDGKYDGQHFSKLRASQIAQIAGRAGRHLKDGSFGVTEKCEPLDDETISAIEDHRFPYLQGVYWRNTDLDFSSLDALRRSLEQSPPHSILTRKADAEDHRALVNLSERREIRRLTHDSENVALLYNVCQIPDYQKNYTDSHVEMLARIYAHLVADGFLSDDWVAPQITRLDRMDGGISTIMTRLAHIRTWTYITQHESWLDGGDEWRIRAMDIEDKLSDKLHLILTQRFIDRRASLLARRLADNDALMSAVKPDGTVIVEGEIVGRLDGLVFTSDLGEGDVDKPIVIAARKALASEITKRVQDVRISNDDAFHFEAKGNIIWREAVIGKLIKGDTLYQPKVQIRPSDMLESEDIKNILVRLNTFVATFIKAKMEKLDALVSSEIDGVAKGIAFQLYENLGIIPRSQVDAMIKKLDEAGKLCLARLGVRTGLSMIYMPDMLKPEQIKTKTLLFNVFEEYFPECDSPPPGQVVVGRPHEGSDRYWLALGYCVLGQRIIRVDIAERLTAVIRRYARKGQFTVSDDMISLAGATRLQMEEILIDFGYVRIGEEQAEDASKPPVGIFTFPKKQKTSKHGERARDKKIHHESPKRQKPAPANQSRTSKHETSPFAVLAKLKIR